MVLVSWFSWGCIKYARKSSIYLKIWMGLEIHLGYWQEASVPSQVDLHRAAWVSFMRWQLTPYRKSHPRRRERRNEHPLHGLDTAVTQWCYCDLLFIRSWITEGSPCLPGGEGFLMKVLVHLFSRQILNWNHQSGDSKMLLFYTCLFTGFKP